MKRAVFKMLASSILVLGANFLTQVFMARELSVRDYGLVIQSMAIASVAQQLIMLGLPSFMVSIVNREGPLVVPVAQLNSTLLINATYAILLGVAYMYTINNEFAWSYVLIIVGAPFMALQEVLISKAQIEKKFTHVAMFNIMSPLIRLGFLLAIAKIYLGVVTVSSVIFLSAALSYFVIETILPNKEGMMAGIGSIKLLRFSGWRNYKKVMGILWPFGFDYVAYIAYYQMPILCLGWISLEIVSQYSAAFSLLGLSFIFPAVLFQKIAPPYISECVNGESLINFPKLKIYSIFYLAIAAIVFFIIRNCSDFFIGHIYGSRFLESASILSFMSIALVPRYISMALGSLFITRADMAIRNRVFMRLTIVSAFLFPVLIQINGQYGAAYAYVTLEFLWVILYLLKINKTEIFIKHKGAVCIS